MVIIISFEDRSDKQTFEVDRHFKYVFNFFK